jgi:hypothetical protein
MKIGLIILPMILVAGITAAVAINGKSNVPVAPPSHALQPINKSAVDKWNNNAIDSTIALLHTGDVALRMGMGADSYLLSQLNHRDKRYSHCGIVVIEGGKPYIYHCIGGEDNPDERMRRDAAPRFFSSTNNTAIAIARFDNNGDQTNKLINALLQYYHKRPLFDMKFDLASDDKLYCSELVYKCLRKARPDMPLTLTQGITGRYVAPDNLYTNDHASFVRQIKFKQYLYQ